MATKYTIQDAQALTHLTHQLRPHWDTKTILQTIEQAAKNGATLADTIHAAHKAATTPTMTTPASILFAENWPKPNQATTPTPKCEDHPNETGHNCPCCWADIKTGQRPRTHLGLTWKPGNPE